MTIREVLMELLCAEGDSIEVQKRLVDSALSEIRNLLPDLCASRELRLNAKEKFIWLTAIKEYRTELLEILK